MAGERLYLDNAATSFPKPGCVLEATVAYWNTVGASAGRGAYREAIQSGQIIFQCRQGIARLIHAADPEHVVFTLNCTDGLNTAMWGLLRAGDHVVTTRMDHNSVLRPLQALRERVGVGVDFVRADPQTGLVDPSDVERAVRGNTRLIAVVHASNVTGSLQPIRQIGAIAQRHGAVFLVDAAQTAGHVPIDVQRDGIDVLACPGHKGLMGPLGTGVLYIGAGLEGRIEPVRQGGTGSVSEQAVHPTFLPDRYEAGSHNAVGIAGLGAGVGWVLEQGVESLWEHDRQLCQVFLEATEGVEGLRVYGPGRVEDRVGVFSVRVEGY